MCKDILPVCPDGLWLEQTPKGLVLTDGQLTFMGDFTECLPRLKQNNLSGELIVKAAKKSKSASPLLLDATAGMGEDSLLLARAGYRVRLYERNPVIAALLRDTIERAKKHPQLSDIVDRMEVYAEDSISAMQVMAEAEGVRPNVILLDPMFPKRSKSGLIKKKFQLLQKLESPCSEQSAEEMLAAALTLKPERIIIKRPLKGPYLADKKPDYSIGGKAIRYDCILPGSHTRTDLKS